MENLPFYVSLVFGLTILLTVFLFYKATRWSAGFLIIIYLWILMQSALSLSGFYKIVSTPPRFPFIIFPPLIIIIALLTAKRGRHFTDSLDLKALTIFHIVRIPVELVLFWLFTYQAIPQLMTFEGSNFDILSGLSAPVVYYFGFVKKSMGKSGLALWNVVCLGLVLNVAVRGVLSAPTPFQCFAFDQPNIAIQYFPFVLLPAVVVPLVILAHLAALRQLLSLKKG